MPESMTTDRTSELPHCQLCGAPPADEVHAAEVQRRWNARASQPEPAVTEALRLAADLADAVLSWQSGHSLEVKAQRLRAALAAVPSPSPAVAPLDADLLHRACADLNLVVRMPPEWGGSLYPWPTIAAEYDRLVAEASEQAASPGEGIGKPRHSGPPYNDEGIPM